MKKIKVFSDGNKVTLEAEVGRFLARVKAPEILFSSVLGHDGAGKEVVIFQVLVIYV
ncbi:MAG TPA: hypothetical protein VI461_16985 [Chitinophagaceae bacterium]|nr:hypothetical protein [Chitinophagaceae bacterium]